jgi:hypothetical protein
VHPTGRNRFELTENVSQSVRCAKPNEQVDMVGNTPDNFRNSIRFADNAAHVGMQLATPNWLDERLVVFCAEHDVVTQT